MEARTAASSSRNPRTSRPRKDANLWTLFVILLILAIAFLIFEFHIRQNIEGPGRPQENMQIMDSNEAWC